MTPKPAAAAAAPVQAAAVDDKGKARPMSSSGGTLLSVKNLTRRYGQRKAVNDVTFDLGPGITGLLGPNGAGKSSLMTCLAGIAAWDEGSIRIGDIDVARHPREARKMLGFMPERVAFPNEMRVEEYLMYVASAKKLPRAGRLDAVELAMKRTGLTHMRTRIVGNLSKGYRQRVGMAQALMGDPMISILDEPMSGLDPLNILDMRGMLQDYARTRTLIVSTHLLADARLMCNRVLVMSLGKLVYQGVPSGMSESTGHGMRLRVRLAGDFRPGEADMVAGTTLTEVQPDNKGVTAVVDARDEKAVADLMKEWSAKWPVTTVEPTSDSLEEAFREAVMGSVHAGEDVTTHDDGGKRAAD
jgi:ABC-2 type transport system ATP-binding protein